MNTPQAALSRRRFIAGLGVGAAALLAGCGQLPFVGAGQVSGGASTAGLADAPPLTLELFDGGEVSLAEQRGKLGVVNFWASWCVPCKAEMPTFEQAWQQYRDKGVVFVGVNWEDIDRDARQFLANEVHVTYTVGRPTSDDQVTAYKVS